MLRWKRKWYVVLRITEVELKAHLHWFYQSGCNLRYFFMFTSRPLISVHCYLPSYFLSPPTCPLLSMFVSPVQMYSCICLSVSFLPLPCLTPPPPSHGSKLYLLWCRMLSSERQYVTVLKGVEETYLPLLELSDTPASIKGKADLLFPSWASLSTFHSQNLLPAMEGALVQSLLQQDCFSKFVSSEMAG